MEFINPVFIRSHTGHTNLAMNMVPRNYYDTPIDISERDWDGRGIIIVVFSVCFIVITVVSLVYFVGNPRRRCVVFPSSSRRRDEVDRDENKTKKVPRRSADTRGGRGEGKGRARPNCCGGGGGEPAKPVIDI